MNKYIKYIIEKNYQAFNPSKLSSDDNTNKSLLSQEDIKDGLYYRPKNPEQLREIIDFLLSKGVRDLNCIDVSNIKDFSYLFQDNRNMAGIDISEWDVSNGEEFTYMFAGCGNFNSDISKWNMKNARKCYNMFNGCWQFDCSLRNWKLPKLGDAANMFANCSQFSSDLSDWVLPNVYDVSRMFSNCPQFDKECIEVWKSLWLNKRTTGYDSICEDI